jgi:hypothetical protein
MVNVLILVNLMNLAVPVAIGPLQENEHLTLLCRDEVQIRPISRLSLKKSFSLRPFS